MNQKELSQHLKQVKTLCASQGARLTPQREQVLSLIMRSKKPVTAYELLESMRQEDKTPAPPTVYRALEFLQEQGLIHKLESLHAFVGCNHPEHPHAGQFLICTDCGEVNEVCNHELDESLNAVEKNQGFSLQRPVIELLGRCASCQK